MKLCTWFLVLSVSLNSTIAARILAVLPIISKSHHYMFQAILRTLAENGHEVVSYSPYPLAQPVSNYTNIDLQIKTVEDKVTWKDVQNAMTVPSHMVSIATMKLVINLMGDVFENRKIKDLINSTEHFDLVIVEAFYGQEAFLGFGHKFQAPVVNIHPFGAHAVASLTAGSPLNLASVPDFPLPYSDKMSFLGRLHNSFTKLFCLYTYYTENLPYQQQVMSKAFNDPSMPLVEELLSNISLYLNNAHPYVNYPQPYPPNTVPLGGIHLAADRTPIPPGIKTFLDEAVHGVIYFNLGSTLNDKILGKQFSQMFINVFRHLPQRVLWRARLEYQNLPENIMMAKWLPQQDILAHPNVVVFITHGGLFSQHEAIYVGVPVVCIPFYIDQPMNAKFYEANNVGVQLLFDNISEDTISSALQTVINNPKYKENMLRLSSIFRDHQQSPAERVLYWIEYVLRYGGAQHLTPSSARLRWYQLWLLDVIAALLVATGVTVATLYLVVSRLLSVCMMRQDPVVGREKKFTLA